MILLMCHKNYFFVENIIAIACPPRIFDEQYVHLSLVPRPVSRSCIDVLVALNDCVIKNWTMMTMLMTNDGLPRRCEKGAASRRGTQIGAIIDDGQ